jgi:hypothetical protein
MRPAAAMDGGSRWALWRDRLLGSPRHPILRHETTYWGRRLGGRWRLEEHFAGATLINLCLLPVALLVFPWLLVAYTVFDEVLGLLITLPAGLLITRERERGTWSILRSTPVEARELAASKLAGLLDLVWEGAAYLARARWFGTLLSLPLFALMLTLTDPFPFSATQPAWLVLVVLIVTYAAFILRPLLHVLFGGALGLALSTSTRSQAEVMTLSALVTSALVALTIGVLIAFVPRHGEAALFSESVLGARLAQVFTWLIPLAAISGLRLLLIPICFALTVWRIGRLSA